MTQSGLSTASDAEIEAAVAATDPMALRGLIYQLTGDESLADIEVRKSRIFFAEAYSIANDEGVALVQSKAVALLKSLRDAGAPQIGFGPPERLPRSLALAAGDKIPPSELDLWMEELALDPWARALKWPAPPDPDKLAKFHVVVIGAGLGGLTAAIQLSHAGIPFTVLEKNEGVGGTWLENRYPGCRVDSPSRAYTHIFAADFIWAHPFSPAAANKAYFDHIADRFDIRKDTKFNTEVQSMMWNEARKLWDIVAIGPEGEVRLSANAVICASGFLARPQMPAIEGMERFNGPAFHTARWPAELDVSDKRVGVVGTGATGYQMVPELANLAKHVVLFQRTAQWIFEIPGYLHEFPKEIQWLDHNLPYHVNFMRFRTNWITGEHVFSHVFDVDPAWQHPHTLSAHNKEVWEGRVAYIKEKFAGRPDLIEVMTPPHPPFSARPLLVDQSYNIYDALLRDDVTLVTGSIARITEAGVVVGDTEHPLDVIVYATGFRANDFLWPMEVRGRGGLRLSELWAPDGARAYLGTLLPGFPNLFVLYGPNTNPIGGGIVNHEELTTRFALEQIARLILEDFNTVEVSQAAYQRYNAEIDRREALKIYADPRAHNYYKNSFGRSSAMCPFVPSELWTWMRYPDPEAVILS